MKHLHKIFVLWGWWGLYITTPEHVTNYYDNNTKFKMSGYNKNISLYKINQLLFVNIFKSTCSGLVSQPKINFSTVVVIPYIELEKKTTSAPPLANMH